MMYLTESERLDLLAALRMAEHRLTYPLVMPGAEATLAAIRAQIALVKSHDKENVHSVA